MRSTPSDTSPVVMSAAVVLFSGLLVMFYLFGPRKPNVIGPMDACRYAYVWMPREQIMSLIRSGKYETEQVTDYGQCIATEVISGTWYAKGRTNVPAMSMNKYPQLNYEAILVVFRDPSAPTVRAFGDQLLPCSFRVDGVDSTSELAPRDLCGKGLNLSAFKQEHTL